ncbi:hypothetical protein K7X08_024833 [Anisodus acutangulus]|uniref:Uncharacterized protein n=1 Tax=Anisodus acutangulus TaxID=402998 RepID=A0A9Q1MDK5_9SOLA|nr:hypothetical protein K7X08_024833 [Anisodus acutangulus]
MSESLAGERFRIGYALAPRSVSSFIQDCLLVHAKERGVDLNENLQDEFVNHGGVIVKVYVAGNHVKRKSLPDITEEKMGNSENLISFSLISSEQSDESFAKLASIKLSKRSVKATEGGFESASI